MSEISFELAGLYYRTDKQKEQANNLSIGDIVKIKPDLFNEYDEFALKIYFKNIFIGYVPKMFSREVSIFILKHKSYIVEVESIGNFINTFFENELTIVFKIYSDINLFMIDKDWFKNKNIIIEGIFKNPTNKIDITSFIQNNGGVLKKVLCKTTNAIIIGQHHISFSRMENMYKLSKRGLIVISEEEILMLL